MNDLVARAALCVLAFAVTASAADITVGPGQSIQAAIVAASAADRVLVQPGTYLEAIDFLGKNIQVIGIGGALVTTIDATGLNTSVVTFKTGEPTTTLLRGFRITGGVGTLVGTTRVGGGIYAAITMTTFAMPTIEECVIENNAVPGVPGGYAGGAYLGPGSFFSPGPTMRRCVVRGNSASSAGGVAGGHIEYTLIENNAAIGAGGGVASPASLRHCRVIGNSATFGGGASVDGGPSVPNSVIEFTTFRGNAALSGGGVYWYTAAGSFVPPAGNVRFCRFEFNQGGGLAMEQASASAANVGVWTCVFRNNPAAGVGTGAVLHPAGSFSNVSTAQHCVFDGDSLVGVSLTAWYCIFLNHPNPVSSTGSFAVHNSISPVQYPGSGSFNANPQFVDSAAGDYHLTVSSPAIDSGGAPLFGAPTTDFEVDAYSGTSDIGADEFAPHVYLHGEASPGANVVLRVIGNPGDSALLFLSPTLAPTPIATPYGDFGLGFPVLLGQAVQLGVVPANGVISLPGTLPANTPLFATFHVQVFLQSASSGVLTNVESIVVL